MFCKIIFLTLSIYVCVMILFYKILNLADVNMVNVSTRNICTFIRDGFSIRKHMY